VIYKE